MLQIYDGRAHFWQWDTNQKLKVDAGHACEVHFLDRNSTTALVVDTYTINGQTVADVPNILLQDDRTLLAWVYICEGDECTKQEARFEVWPRQKPADYVYTETEIKHFSDLDKRVSALEGAGTVLPPVTEADNGKHMVVVNGVWQAAEDEDGVNFETDETLVLKDGILSVNRAEAVEKDNSLPITSAAVYTEVGNINALLRTI